MFVKTGPKEGLPLLHGIRHERPAVRSMFRCATGAGLYPLFAVDARRPESAPSRLGPSRPARPPRPARDSAILTRGDPRRLEPGSAGEHTAYGTGGIADATGRRPRLRRGTSRASEPPCSARGVASSDRTTTTPTSPSSNTAATRCRSSRSATNSPGSSPTSSTSPPCSPARPSMTRRGGSRAGPRRARTPPATGRSTSPPSSSFFANGGSRYGTRPVPLLPDHRRCPGPGPGPALSAGGPADRDRRRRGLRVRRGTGCLRLRGVAAQRSQRHKPFPQDRRKYFPLDHRYFIDAARGCGHDPEALHPDVRPAGSYLEGVDQFEPGFFDIPSWRRPISTRCTVSCSSTSTAAIEHSGMTGRRSMARGRRSMSARTAPSPATSSRDRERFRPGQPGHLGGHPASRLNYLYDLQGGSLVVDTACRFLAHVALHVIRRCCVTRSTSPSSATSHSVSPLAR